MTAPLEKRSVSKIVHILKSTGCRFAGRLYEAGTWWDLHRQTESHLELVARGTAAPAEKLSVFCLQLLENQLKDAYPRLDISLVSQPGIGGRMGEVWRRSGIGRR